MQTNQELKKQSQTNFSIFQYLKVHNSTAHQRKHYNKIKHKEAIIKQNPPTYL